MSDQKTEKRSRLWIFAVQLALAGATFGSCALFMSWKSAGLTMSIVLVHESGHLWAMKRCGLKTKGIWFVPFIGAATVAKRGSLPRRDEAFISWMGPLWGLGSALLAFIAYLATGVPFWAAAAGWTAGFNLFNLLPVYSFDGGNIMKPVADSLTSTFGKLPVLLFVLFNAVWTYVSFDLGRYWPR